MQPSNNNHFDFFISNSNQVPGQQNQQNPQDQKGQICNPNENQIFYSQPSSNHPLLNPSKRRSKIKSDGHKNTNIQSEKKIKSDSVFEVFKSVSGEYEIIRALGKGSYGAVAKAIEKKTGRAVAIKKYFNLFKDKIDTKRILREIAIISRMDHPNITKVYDIIIPDKETLQEIFLVMELCDTDLKTLLYGSSKTLSEAHIKKIMYDILNGMDYLHKSGVIHRDLKPANIVVNLNNVTAKIADFGLARDLTLEYDTQMLVELFLNYSKKDPNINYEEIRNYLLSNQPIPTEVHDLLQENLEILQEELFRKFCNPQKIENDKKSIAFFNENLVDSGDPPSYQLRTHDLVIQPYNLLLEVEKDQVWKKNKNYYATYERLMNRDSKLKKQMTQHVMTRWYRAPEIILFEPFYSAPVDVWAIGCIFGELLGKLLGNKSTGPLFPGTSCYPMSPMIIQNQNKVCVDVTDQFISIMRVLGSPQQSELEFIVNKNALDYVYNLGYFPKQDFLELYPGCSAEDIKLLLSFLNYDPRKRITITEALNDKYFDDIRQTVKFYSGIDYSLFKPSLVCLEYEKDGVVHDHPELKVLFLKEYSDFKKKFIDQDKMLEAAGLELDKSEKTEHLSFDVNMK